eukprot:5159918-Prorocentrum_lima.AAC.1
MPELRQAEADRQLRVKRGLHNELPERLHGISGVGVVQRVDLRVPVQEPSGQFPGRRVDVQQILEEVFLC